MDDRHSPLQSASRLRGNDEWAGDDEVGMTTFMDASRKQGTGA